MPLLVGQDASSRAAAWAAADDALAIWTLTPVEVVSALRRLVREQVVDEETARLAEDRMDEMTRMCHVVVDVDAVKALAVRSLRLHSLQASDALQLGAALHWAEGRPQGRTLHTMDGRLALAARREGFRVPT